MHLGCGAMKVTFVPEIVFHSLEGFTLEYGGAAGCNHTGYVLRHSGESKFGATGEWFQP